MKSIIPCALPIASLLWMSAGAAELPNIVQIEGYATAAAPAEVRTRPVNRCLGFMVEKEGFLLTTYSTLTDPTTGRLLEDFQVRVGEGTPETLAASIIGVEPTLNLGILKIESDRTFRVSTSAPNRSVTVGAQLSAVGGFRAGAWQRIEGAVAGLNTRQCYQESLASTMFRAKIGLAETSLGGPVFFSDTGEVAAIYTGFKPVAEPGHQEESNETHLLPISLCFNIYESIKQKRSLKSPWTGFSVRALNDAEKRFFPTAKKHHGGVAIEGVWENSPAQKLGIQVNDILVQFSYNRILSVADFQKWLYMYGVGHPVKLMVLRNGTEYLITDYVIEERPSWAKPK